MQKLQNNSIFYIFSDIILLSLSLFFSIIFPIAVASYYFFIFEILLLIPIFFVLYDFRSNLNFSIKKRYLFYFIFIFIYSLFLIRFVPNMDYFYNWYVISFFNVPINSVVIPSFNFLSIIFGQFSFFFYIDCVSFFFIILTTFLIPVCLLISWYSINEKVLLFLFCLCFLNFALINAFWVSNLFYFFIFFEAILFPMFLIIGLWGSRDRKLHAVFQFLIYTLVGSITLYVCIFYLLFNYDSLDFLLLKNCNITFIDQCIIFLLLFISFAFKLPMFPVHIWLPEAHVEAPTFGSVILAGLLLKLGTYGMFRFMLPLTLDALYFFTPIVLSLTIIGIFYTSFSTTRQTDLKKIIAYSSVGHMGFVVLGLFSPFTESLAGSVYLMLGHGLISSGLFILVGMMYDRYHTRNISDLRGLVRFMPLYAIAFLILTLSNISFPGTFNFIAEFCILLGLGQLNFLAFVIVCFSILFILIYSFWVYNRVMFGDSLLSLGKHLVINKYVDLSFREFVIIFIFIFLIILFGIFPNIILNKLIFYCEYILVNLN